MKLGYETVIGLEVHAELSTKSKIFCGCKNAFGAPPNTLCCPVCTGMPGALPVLNRQVVEYAVMMGHALHCHINKVSHLDRKHYFYPDLPKAYQISQFDVPLCQGGYLDFLAGDEARRIGVERLHIEEDAGKLLHRAGQAGTLVDFNRCGVPLIEIVTQPDLRSADEAKACLEAITAILLYLGISDAKMQEGSVRVDVNVSVRAAGSEEYGPRVEMKNVASFGAVHRAICFEAARQLDIVAQGGTVLQETRRWDDARGTSTVLRSKEDAPDYCYFPDPDLPAFRVELEEVQRLKDNLPELPLEKARRYRQEYGLSAYDAGLLTASQQRAAFFEEGVALDLCKPKALANWLNSEVLGLLNDRALRLEDTALTPKSMAGMIALIEAGDLSGAGAKQVLALLLEESIPPAEAMRRLNLAQVSDAETLRTIVQKVLAENPKAVADYKNGKTGVLGFLVGRCMGESHGRGNPAMLKTLLEDALESR